MIKNLESFNNLEDGQEIYSYKKNVSINDNTNNIQPEDDSFGLTVPSFECVRKYVVQSELGGIIPADVVGLDIDLIKLELIQFKDLVNKDNLFLFRNIKDAIHFAQRNKENYLINLVKKIAQISADEFDVPIEVV